MQIHGARALMRHGSSSGGVQAAGGQRRRGTAAGQRHRAMRTSTTMCACRSSRWMRSARCRTTCADIRHGCGTRGQGGGQ